MSFRGTRAGKFRQVIQINHLVENGRDEAGGVVLDWEPLHADLRADVNPGRGREFETAKQRNHELSHLITTRTIPGIDLADYAEHQVVLDGDRVLRILYVINKDETNRELLFACTEAQ